MSASTTFRIAAGVVLVVGGFKLVAGCFRPSVVNGGFACEPSDDPPCPANFFCVRGRCVDAPAGIDDASVMDDLGAAGDDFAVAERDLASTSRDLSKAAPDLAQADLAGPPQDLAEPKDLAQPPKDLAQPRDMTPPPDLTPTSPDLSCLHAGGPCTSPAVCCSNYCRSDGICIGG